MATLITYPLSFIALSHERTNSNMTKMDNTRRFERNEVNRLDMLNIEKRKKKKTRERNNKTRDV